MEEKQICCCGSSGWTRVIGWFQLIGSVLSIISLAFLLVASSALRANVDNAKNPQTGAPLTPDEIQKLKTELTAAIVGSIVLLILAVVAFIMAIFLLRGSHNKNPRQIHAWMVYTVICLVISTIKTIAQCFVSPTGDVIASTIITLVFLFAIQGFCLWVVGTHKKEIEASVRPVYPVKA